MLVKLYLSTTFFQGLVTAAASAFISGAFLLFSTHMMARKTEKKVEDATVTILEEQHAQAQSVKDTLDAKQAENG